MDTYWYLATPYTKFPGGHEAANILAVENAALLLKAGVPTFSPIAHTHPLHKIAGLDGDHDFWINTVDRPMMRGAHGLIHLQADNWQWSSGMHDELAEFVKAGKPIVFMQPGVVPAEFLPHPTNNPPQPEVNWYDISAQLRDTYDDPRRYSV